VRRVPPEFLYAGEAVVASYSILVFRKVDIRPTASLSVSFGIGLLWRIGLFNLAVRIDGVFEYKAGRSCATAEDFSAHRGQSSYGHECRRDRRLAEKVRIKVTPVSFASRALSNRALKGAWFTACGKTLSRRSERFKEFCGDSRLGCPAARAAVFAPTPEIQCWDEGHIE
jgi:hypothetical protein